MIETRGAVALALCALTACGDDSAGTGGGGGATAATTTATTTAQATTGTAASSTADSGTGGQPGSGGGGSGGGGGGGGGGGAGGGNVDACGEPSGEGMLHQGVIDADEEWLAEDGPHIVTGDVFVDGASLRIEPCAVVRIARGYHITVDGAVDSPGALRADGSYHGIGHLPTLFEREVEDEPWGAIVVHEYGEVDLRGATLRGGGDPDTAVSGGGSLVVTGDALPEDEVGNLVARDVHIDGSATHGANLTNRAGFYGWSNNLVITGSAGHPLVIDGSAVSTIPEGTYTGNGADQILVRNATSLTDEAITFFERGVPYRFEGSFTIAPEDSAADGGLSTVTLEAGVVLLFEKNASTLRTFGLGTSNGTAPENIWPVRLIAEGTADAPIVLTSAEETPVAGDWGGIYWAGGPATGNVMSHVRIEYAGGDGGTSGFGCGPAENDAAIVITNWRPDDAFLSDCTIADSAGGGIVSGWYSDEAGPDLRGVDNTFTDIANGCEVSRWRDADSDCPGTPPLCL